MLEPIKRYDIQVEGTRDQGDVKLFEHEAGDLVYYYEMRLHIDRQNLETFVLKRRLAESEDRALELQTKVILLESELKGPEPFITWQDAAVSERVRRVAAEKEVRAANKRDEEAVDLIERWLQTDKTHDWTGFQKRVEKFLNVNQPEPIPKNVRWDASMDDFYCTFYDFRSMGEEFRNKWFTRWAEFPTVRDCIGRP